MLHSRPVAGPARARARGRRPGRPVLPAALAAVVCAGALLSSKPAHAGRIPLVRVGIAPESGPVTLASRGGGWRVGIVGTPLRPTRVAEGERWTFRPRGDHLEVVDGGGRPRGAVRDTVYAFPENPESGALVVDGRAYRGQVLLWASAGRTTCVNVIDLEAYLRAVLPPELGPQPPARMEALRAQAVAARSYTLATLGRWRQRGFDLLPTVEDQVYGGLDAERPACSQAVEETRGVVALHAGAPIQAFYSSTCGGHTASLGEAWNRPPAPYLRGVRDRTGRVSRSFCAASPVFEGTEEWDGPFFEEMVRGNLERIKGRSGLGRLRDVSIEGRSRSRRVSDLRLRFDGGTVDLGGDEIRWILRRPDGGGLRSALLTGVAAARSKGRIARVRVAGRGYGHGVGLCQFGALGMAEAGYGYGQIVRFYYRGVDLRRFY